MNRLTFFLPLFFLLSVGLCLAEQGISVDVTVTGSAAVEEVAKPLLLTGFLTGGVYAVRQMFLVGSPLETIIYAIAALLLCCVVLVVGVNLIVGMT